MNSNYFKKYFKYKNKYLLLKNKLGGSQFTIPTYSEELVNKFTDFLNLTCNQLQNADNLKDIDDEVINFFLPKQYNIKKKDETTTDLIDNEGADFRTLLIHACSCLSDDNDTDGHDKPQLIIDLLGKGSDVNAKDINGWNALMHASANGSIETCTVLLDKGASPDSNNSDNNNATNKTSALILAVHADNIQLCLLLISRFADINLKVNNKNALEEFNNTVKLHSNILSKASKWWEDKKSTSRETFLFRKDSSDLKLIVGKEEIFVHRFILFSSAINVVDPIIRNGILERSVNNENITITDSSVIAVKEMVRFIYTGKVDKTELEKDMINALKLAINCKLKMFRQECETFIIEKLKTFDVNDKNFTDYINIADIPKLINIIKKNPELIRKDQYDIFKELNQSLYEQLYDSFPH